MVLVEAKPKQNKSLELNFVECYVSLSGPRQQLSLLWIGLA
jgi:hypothetical protein